jgi:tryptophan synthase alpha chain
MNRIDQAFKKRPAFMPYYPLGYPNLETSIDVIEALASHGADLIEVGLSFSDPLADGPVIQKATQIALEKGITIKKSMEALSELRRRGLTIPLVLMGYYNPMLAYGLEIFIHDATLAGADGFIIPDLPPEESSEFEALCDGLPLIRMLAPTTPAQRMEMISRKAKGFIYLVSVAGVTGARQSLGDGLDSLIKSVKDISEIPVCVGFGISTPEQAREVGKMANGVIVGSACVRAVGESKTPVDTAEEFSRSFSKALSENSSVQV